MCSVKYLTKPQFSRHFDLRFFFSSRRQHTSSYGDWSSDVCSSDLEYDGDLAQALTRVYPQLEGHFTIVAIHHDQPDLLVGVRNQTPLVLGLGNGENFLASNVEIGRASCRERVKRPVMAALDSYHSQ